MNPPDNASDPEPWYAARCVFRHEGLRDTLGRTIYEERIVLLRADSSEHAFDLAEVEAAAYAASNEFCTFTGHVDLFHLFDAEVGHGSEIYSLMRASLLNPADYRQTFLVEGTDYEPDIGPVREDTTRTPDQGDRA